MANTRRKSLFGEERLTISSSSVMDLASLLEAECGGDPAKESMLDQLLKRRGDKKVLSGEYMAEVDSGGRDQTD